MFLFLINHCDFDKYLAKYETRHAVPINDTKRKLAAGSRRIRIEMDFEYLGSHRDNNECNYAGQIVNWASAKNFVCTQEDVLTQKKIDSIKTTMLNVKSYLESIFSVDPVTYSFELYRPDYFYNPIWPKTVSGVDLHLTVTSRPMDSGSTLASAGPLQEDPQTNRPIQGGVYINPRTAPETPQDEHSQNCNFFYTCVHEIFHAMGITSQLYDTYHPRHDNRPHQTILCDLNDYRTGKKHQILVTPYAHKFAMMQWGTEVFRAGSQSCPSGIPIEDGGGQGTAGSHPEGRISTTDLMGGVSYQTEAGPYNRFTPLTMAILLDTGYYDIDYRKIQPLLWGNKDTTKDGQYIRNFVTDPPERVFPQQYIYRPNRDPYFDPCGFDFKTTGGLNKFSLSAQGSRWDCNNPAALQYANVKAYCEAKSFYNANNNDEIGGDWPNDFQILHFPSEVCGRGKACIAGSLNCTSYTIAPDEKSFKIKLFSRVEPNEVFEYECNEGNVGVNYTYREAQGNSGYYYNRVVQCPPIRQFIKTVQMYEDMPFYTYDPFGGSEPLPPPPGPEPEPEPLPATKFYVNLRNPTSYTFKVLIRGESTTLGPGEEFTFEDTVKFTAKLILDNGYCKISFNIDTWQTKEFYVIKESEIPAECKPNQKPDVPEPSKPTPKPKPKPTVKFYVNLRNPLSYTFTVVINGESSLLLPGKDFSYESTSSFVAKLIIDNGYCKETFSITPWNTPDYYSLTEAEIPPQCKPGQKPEPPAPAKQYVNINNPTKHTFVITFEEQSWTLEPYKSLSLNADFEFTVQMTLTNQYCTETRSISSRASQDYIEIKESDIPEKCKKPKQPTTRYYAKLYNPTSYTFDVRAEDKVETLKPYGKFNHVSVLPFTVFLGIKECDKQLEVDAITNPNETFTILESMIPEECKPKDIKYYAMIKNPTPYTFTVEIDGKYSTLPPKGQFSYEDIYQFTYKLIINNGFCYEVFTNISTTSPEFYQFNGDIIPASCKAKIISNHYINLRNPTDYTFMVTVDGETTKLAPTQELTFESSTKFTAQIRLTNSFCDETFTIESSTSTQYYVLSDKDIPVQCKPFTGQYYLNLDNPTDHTFTVEIVGKEPSQLLPNKKFSYKSSQPFTANLHLKNEYCDETISMSPSTNEDFYVISEEMIPSVCKPLQRYYLNLINPTGHVITIRIDGKTTQLLPNGEFSRVSGQLFDAEVFIINQFCEEKLDIKPSTNPENYIISEKDIPKQCLSGSNAEEGESSKAEDSEGKSSSKTLTIMIVVTALVVVVAVVAFCVYWFAIRPKKLNEAEAEDVLDGTLLV